MHIVYVIAPGGGPDAYVRTCASWLEDEGHRVSVIYTVRPSELSVPLPPSVRVSFAPCGSMHYYLWKMTGGYRAWPRRLRAWEQSWAVYRALAQIERAERIDLVEVTEGLPLAFIKRHWTVVVRAHASDWTVRYFCQDGDQGTDRWLVEMEANQLRQARAVSALSHHLADHLSDFCKFPRERIEVIPYPMDTQHFCPVETSRSNSQPPAVLSIGRLEKRKGVDVLLRALPKVWQHFSDLRLYLIGKAADFSEAELRALIPAEKREQVITVGYLDRAKIPDYHRRATIYATPTLYETFGYSILEAMACGTAVVATRVGGIQELVEDGVTGLLVPPRDPNALADAMIALLEDPVRREQMGKRGREKAVAEYGLEEILDRMLDFYGRVLSKC